MPSDPHIMFSSMQTESIRIEIDPGDVLHWRKTNKKRCNNIHPINPAIGCKPHLINLKINVNKTRTNQNLQQFLSKI